MKVNNVQNAFKAPCSTSDKICKKGQIKDNKRSKENLSVEDSLSNKNIKKAEKIANDFAFLLTKELYKDVFSSFKHNNVIYDALITDEYAKIVAPKTGISKKILPFILKNYNSDNTKLYNAELHKNNK